MVRIKPTPKPFQFSYPEGRTLEGTVLEEFHKDYEDEGYTYRKFMQLCEAEGEKLIRFGYWRKPTGSDDNSWVFGSQTAPLLQIEILEDMIKYALEHSLINVD